MNNLRRQCRTAGCSSSECVSGLCAKCYRKQAYQRPRAILAREWKPFANIHCATQREFGLAVNYHSLAVALHNAYNVDWSTALTFARLHVDVWLLNEERRLHPSIREAQP